MHWLLIFAGVNLAMSAVVAVYTITRRPQTARRRALVGLPALWALLMLGAYGYLWETMPPSPILGYGPHKRPILQHGNVAQILWEEHVNTASGLAFWLTVLTLLGLLALWLARSLHLRRWRLG